MKETIEEVLTRETNELRKVCQRVATMQGPIAPEKVRLYFTLILNISAEANMLEKYAYGQFKIFSGETMLTGLSTEKKVLLFNQLADMTQAEIKTSDTGPRTRTTHYDLLANWYEELGYGRADMVLYEYQNKDNPYILELSLISALFKAAKQKVSIMLALMQAIQFMEPFIINAFVGIANKMVKPGTDELYFPEGTFPQYVEQHQHKDYHNHPILLTYYGSEVLPKVLNGYCARHAHIFNDAFIRLNEIMFPESETVDNM